MLTEPDGSGAAKAARLAMTQHIEHAGELLAIHIESVAAQREQASAIRHP